MNFSPDTRYFNEPAFEQELPASMLEQRYAAEGRLLEAVSRGDTEAALQAMNVMGRFRIQGRFFRYTLSGQDAAHRHEHPVSQSHRAQHGPPLLY